MANDRKQIIYHCGSYKTGSSSLQDALFHGAGPLADAGVLYPETGIRFDRTQLGHRHSEFARAATPNMLLALQNEISLSDAHTVVLSSEAWSDVDHHLSLWAFIGIMGRDVDIDHQSITYFRNVYIYAVKHYREFTVRWRNPLTFPQYLRARKHLFDYVLIAQRLNQIFAGHQSRYFSYDETGDVVEHFTRFAGLPDVRRAKGDGSIRINKGRGAVDVEIFRLLNSKLKPHQAKRIDVDSIVNNHPFKDEEAAFQEDFSALSRPFNATVLQQMRAYCSFSSEQVEQLFELPDISLKPINKLRPNLTKYVDQALAKELA